MPTNNVQQPYYPPLDPSIPAPVATHLKMIYTGLNQHDTAISTLAGNSSSQSGSNSGSTNTPTGGGANGNVTLAALTTGGTQGSLTISNGLITAFTNPT